MKEIHFSSETEMPNGPFGTKISLVLREVTLWGGTGQDNWSTSGHQWHAWSPGDSSIGWLVRLVKSSFGVIKKWVQDRNASESLSFPESWFPGL
jgi:hypothetical protein